MGRALTSTQQDALDYLYGGGDETIECQRAEWVWTRYSHACLSVMHQGGRDMAAGSRMMRETAKVEGRFGSCYTCDGCITAAISELARGR